jgi:hypothetical protein
VYQEQLDNAVLECKERWMVERSFDPDLIKHLDQYLEQLPIKSLAGAEPPHIIPGANATLTHPRLKGGASAALYENRVKRLTGLADQIFALQEHEWSYAGAAGADFPADQVEDVFNAFDDLADLLECPRLPTPQETRKDYLAGPVRQPLKPHPLTEMGGKVRVVTLHPAEEVTVARGITALWLRGLRRCVTTRDMLRGRQVVIERQCKRSKLYSADLSAATDYIPHGLAIHVG